ncbi:hypothetical protein AAG570_008614 [Ranatra chinensis]|uniref:Uncharacterized protein n=1 Tax=Ranatra chinensis TaxID=642074 RepID=A0ABD0YRI1_9HEMI
MTNSRNRLGSTKYYQLGVGESTGGGKWVGPRGSRGCPDKIGGGPPGRGPRRHPQSTPVVQDISSAMVWRAALLVSLFASSWTISVPRPPTTESPPPTFEPQVWLNFEGEVLDFLLVFGTDLLGKELGLPDLRILDASLSGVVVDKLYEARISSTPVLKGYGFNEFSIDAGLDFHMRLHVNNFTTGELSFPGTITVFDVRAKVKLIVIDLFRPTCKTRVRPTALSFGQILLITGGNKIILDEKSGTRSLLQESVLEYLNDNLFHILDDVLSYDSYVCNR